MFNKLDKSPFLLRLLQQFSTALARQRGLPVIIGIAIFVVSIPVQIIALVIDSQALQIIGIIVNGIGVLIALIGILLAEPWGR